VTSFAVFCLYQLYQMYGRRTPEDVFDIMTKYSVSYIILEDSHCLAPSHNGCRLPDLVDVDNGIVCFSFTYCLQLPSVCGYYVIIINYRTNRTVSWAGSGIAFTLFCSSLPNFTNDGI